ncbi:MAG: hypothetical protein LBS79_04105 [Tannerella sp.]|jgi:hypothetical protein|nr:hypothetical protein [Tannerella sp.]
MKPLAKVYLLAVAFVFVNQSRVAAYCDDSRIDSLRMFVYNSEMSFSDKLAAVEGFNGVSMCTGSFHKVLFPLLNDFLEQAKKEKHVKGKFFCYSFIADLHIGLWNREQAKAYLDSVEMQIEQVDDMEYLAPYYRMKGQYIQRYYSDRSPEAVTYYHKSLSYYEKSGFAGKENDLVIILRNLTIDGFQRNDSTYIYRYISNLADMQKKYESSMLDFSLMDIKANLYDFFYQRSQDEAFLDTSIYYAKKGLEIYENGLLTQFYKQVAIDLYVMTAELINKKKESDLTVVDSLLELAWTEYDLADSLGIARIYQAKAKILFSRKMIDSAEVIALKAQKFLEMGYRNNYYLLAKANIDLLREIYDMKGDYKKVIEYNDLWIKKDEEIRSNEVKELELRYEVESKEAEIKRLDLDRLYQESRYKKFVLICCLLCLAIFFVSLLIRLKRRDLNNQIALINSENEEAKLKLKLKEEQTVKMQLEKYEVLSDFHLKEMELIGKSKDLDLLRQDKDALDRQVELYRQKVDAYESMMNTDKECDYDTHNVIVEDLKHLIKKQIKAPLSDEYISNIEQMNKSFVEMLREKSNETLSVSYLKYCICFAIGIGIADVAECFSIEPSSVHMIRYRLKKKFGLGNDDDLGLFLQKYASS